MHDNFVLTHAKKKKLLKNCNLCFDSQTVKIGLQKAESFERKSFHGRAFERFFIIFREICVTILMQYHVLDTVCHNVYFGVNCSHKLILRVNDFM